MAPTGINYTASFETNNITIQWQSDEAVDHYELQYNFTIIDCTSTSDTDEQYNSSVIETTMDSYVIANNVTYRVEENSNYVISLIVVGSNGRSQPEIIMGKTKESGIL